RGDVACPAMVEDRVNLEDGQVGEDFFNGRLQASGAWTIVADWREDDEVLTARFTYPNERHATSVLPYGLERLGGRRLALALPPSALAVSRNRAAFLDADISIHTHADG